MKDAKKLESTYVKAQEKFWHGDPLLDQLITTHGKVNIDRETRQSLIKILSLVIAGEAAAWQTSANLSANITDYTAKLAATAQSHDEARHFRIMLLYVIHVLGATPDDLRVTKTALAGLDDVTNTNSTLNMLLGMQLMVEPVALTLFRSIRNANIDPVLSGLMEFYERDEARHIALGVIYLPEIIRKSSYFELLSMTLWQIKMLKAEVDGLKEISRDLKSVNIDPKKLLKEAERRQLDAAEEMVDVLGWGHFIPRTMRWFVRTYISLTW